MRPADRIHRRQRDVFATLGVCCSFESPMKTRCALYIVLTSVSFLLCCDPTLSAISRSPRQNPKSKRGRPHVWPPLQTSYSRKEFVGPEACAECHFSEFASQKVTAMAHAAHLPIEA